MVLANPSPGQPVLKAELVPAARDSADIKSVVSGPFASPWRTVTVAESAGKLMESRLILNLNDPCVICDQRTDWIQPAKYVGIWWEIHKGASVWSPGKAVGATTQNAMTCIDFAPRHGIPFVLAEGWNGGL